MSKYKQLLKEAKTVQKPPKKLGRGQGSQTPFLDHYRNLRKPSQFQLIESYKRTVFACANINAAAVARTPLKLYVKTNSGDKAPRVATKAIKSEKIDYLTENYIYKSVKNVEEVVEHPVLDLLKKANSSIWLNGQQLSILTQLYQEVIGKCYWHVTNHPILNIPEEIWVIPTYLLNPYNEIGSDKIVDYYELETSEGKKPIPVDEIVQFLMPNLADPYVGGR
jgi:hypothetical protein